MYWEIVLSFGLGKQVFKSIEWLHAHDYSNKIREREREKEKEREKEREREYTTRNQ